MPVLVSIVSIMAGALLGLLIIHMILSRTFSEIHPQKIAVFAIILSYLPLFFFMRQQVSERMLSGQGLIGFWLYCFVVYTGFSYAYFHLFNMSETARRIRIMYDIYVSGTLSSEKIEDQYNTSAVIRTRLTRLLGTGQLRLTDGYYSIHGRTLYRAAVVISLWRRLLNLDQDRIK